MRLFIAIDANVHADYFKRLQQHLPDCRLTQEFHLTLVFLGDQNNPEKIITALDNIKHPKFDLQFDTVDHFFGHTIFVNVHSESLMLLQQKVIDALQIKPEKKFHPHITLARCKKHIPLNIIHEERKMKSNKFSLIHSTLTKNGPIYKTIKVFHLGND